MATTFRGVCFLICLTFATCRAEAGQLEWDAAEGVILKEEKAAVQFGGNALTNSLRLRFPANRVTQTVRCRLPSNANAREIILVYETTSPTRVPVTVERRIRTVADPEGVALVEQLTLSSSVPLTNDVEVELPFAVQIPYVPMPTPPKAAAKPSSSPKPPPSLPPKMAAERSGEPKSGQSKKTPAKPAPAKPPRKSESKKVRSEPEMMLSCPLQNGWMCSFPLSNRSSQVEYRLGNPLTASFGIVSSDLPGAGTNGPSTNKGRIATGNAGQDDASTPQLALPLVQLSSGDSAAAIFADPEFSTLFVIRPKSADGMVRGVIRYRYAAGKIPLRAPETRRFAVWIPAKKQVPADPGPVLDAWFRLMLPEVPPGPAWLHDIGMVGYDFLSDDGQGWERDIRVLSEWLKPAERGRVALCLHGWYDALGSYCYDEVNKKMKESWVAFERTRKVAFTQEELKRRLKLAREQGFRVLLYFGDGLAADSGFPGYHDDWAYRDLAGRKTPGWQGPDTFGPTYLMNPAHPAVVAWFTNYLGALLTTYGRDIDGLVWDETFHARIAQIASAPEPAYCDRAMFNLVRALTQQVHRFDAQKVFLASDCIGVPGMENVPGYALVADGTYQDSHCDPVAWSYGVFPNWRNCLWSCNWDSLNGFHFTRWGVEQFGAPVAISNGWGDDRGASEWTPNQRERILALFRERMKTKRPIRPLLMDPRVLASGAPDRAAGGDPIPEPAEGELNWALALNGSRASASSSEQTATAAWPASGAIDGVRDDAGWGTGHGWASKSGEALPQWLEVDFGQERSIERFVVITYQKENSAETAGKWGIQNYQIEGWDKRKQKWQPLGSQDSGLVLKTRVHRLTKPVLTNKCRLVVTKVAPLDGQARLLQFEAWGR